MRRRLLLILTCALLPARAAAPAPPEETAALRVAAVQLSVDAAMLRSLDLYRGRISEAVGRCLAYHPDLIVFPEYTGAFLTLIPYRQDLDGAVSVQDGLERIRRREPLVGDLHELFLLGSGWTERALQEIFAPLARDNGVTILAGSYFAWSRVGQGMRLTNRAVAFGPDGRVVYSQDKVYLTPFEEQLLRLSPGELEAAGNLVVRGRRIGLTICRDTFFTTWEERLRGSDLWVDIKANGQPFTTEEQERFLRALPARIRSGAAPWGLTVCLTGRLLDLVWEGESSVVALQAPGELRTVVQAASPRDQEILTFSVAGR